MKNTLKWVALAVLACALATGAFAQADTGTVYIAPTTTGSVYPYPNGVTVGGGYGSTGTTIYDTGAISTDGLITGAAGLTVTGGAVNLNASSNNACNIGTGTTTGAVTVGGTGTQTIAVGNGAGAKTVALGSATGASATTISAGTGDMTITSVDDLTINGGSAGSIINLGTNTQGNVINVATDDTTADTITIGSAKDALTLKSVNLSLDTVPVVSAADPQVSGAKCFGQATLTAGNVVVNTTCAATASLIYISAVTPTADTHTYVANTIVNGVSFTITGLIDNGTINAADNTSVVNWMIVN